MKQSKQNVFLYLTGGLGNQLFQYAALNSISYTSDKYVISNLGNPRRNTLGLPEIVTILGDNISFREFKGHHNWLIEKVIGLNLRLSVRQSSNTKLIFRATVRITSNMVLSILVGKFTRIVFNVECNPNRIFHNTLLVGYFQVADYAQKLSKVILNSSASQHPQILEFANRAKKEKPLVIHIRRGDYVKEKDFGVLNQSYYQNSFADFTNSKDIEGCQAIWIFSDDIHAAQKALKLDSNLEQVWISEIADSAALTLLAMSFGSSFVIANSTFSWWAAHLAQFPQNVYYPQKWFKNLNFSPALFPKDWIGIRNGFELPSDANGQE